MQGLLRLVPFISIALVLSCSNFAFADNREPPTDSVLNGKWRADVSGSQMIVLTISGTKIEMSALSEGKKLPSWTGKFIISSPNQHMDWVELESGNTKLPDNKCLFRLSGDVLLVIGGGPNQRPTRFYSGPGTDPKTLVFLRVNKNNEEAVPSDAPSPPALSTRNGTISPSL